MILHSPAQLQQAPQRIVSLVPSQTALLFDLGLAETVTGITKFCIHPKEWRKTKIIIGGTKNIHPDKIDLLKPDLIIANKEENVKEQVEALAEKFPVLITDVSTLPQALQMIETIGSFTNRQSQAVDLINHINQQFATIKKLKRKISTVYLIWRNPYMTVGGDTFINNMMQYCGFDNLYSEQKRYPTIEIAALQKSGCELLLLSSEPYPFKQQHIDELQHQLPNTTIMLVDGEMFSWYGSRLRLAPAYFNHLIDELNNSD